MEGEDLEEFEWQVLENLYGVPRTSIVPIIVQGQVFHIDPAKIHLYSSELLESFDT